MLGQPALDSGQPSRLSTPSVEEIRVHTLSALQKRPCMWQIDVCRAILGGGQDIISVARTGAGKTLTFWLPLLFCSNGIQIVITPLNILGQQNIDTLAKAGVKGIFIYAKTATKRNFEDIASFKYRVIVVNPEELMRPEGGFQALFKNRHFADAIISIIIDEAHCITQWGSFRPEYRHIGSLRHIQRNPCPVMATSATLTPAAIADIKKTLALDEERLFFSKISIDRPNINIAVRPMLNTRTSFLDLDFLLRGWTPGGPAPAKFLVFFDSIPESVQAGLHLRKLLPPEYRDRIKWFNSEMSDRFKTQETEKLSTGEIWGLMTTDSFGMGMDIPDILLIIQWGATCSISTLWQRFGRCVRNPDLEGTAVLFTERDHLDPERQKKTENAAKRRARAALKKKGVDANKRPRLTSASAQSASRVEDHVTESSDEEPSNDPVKEAVPPAAKSKKLKKSLDPFVDDLINAEHRGYQCRRVPILAAFKDDEAVLQHHECDPQAPTGCTRCGPQAYRLCCDLHNPAPFAACLESQVVKTTRQPARSTLDKVTRDETDQNLRRDLEKWRCEETEKIYGRNHLQNLGPGLIMGDDVRERIVDCAHFSKISTTADLDKEMKWNASSEFGSAIIAIIRRHYPLPPSPPSPQPLQSQATSSFIPYMVAPLLQNAQNISVSSSKTRRRPRCSVCGIEGHTMRNTKKCKGGLTTKTLPGKENMPQKALLPIEEDEPLILQSRELQQLCNDILHFRP